MADVDWRLEYLSVETPDRLISLFQIMKIERLALRWCAKNGGKVAALLLCSPEFASLRLQIQHNAAPSFLSSWIAH